jgi:hypothetical protein
VKHRALLTAGAALLTVAAAALAVPGLAGAAASTADTSGPAAATAAALIPSSGNVTLGPMAGVVLARGTSTSALAGLRAAGARSALAAAPAAGCKEPDCNLGYHGGPVQHAPHIYVWFWGGQWGNANNAKMMAAKRYVNNFFKGIGTAHDVWTQTVMQYGDKKGRPVVGKGLIAGIHTDAIALPRSISPNAIGNEAAKAVRTFKIKDVNNAEIVILAQSGACFAPQQGITFAGNCGKVQSIGGYCGYHTFVPISQTLFLPIVNLPFEPDAAAGCGQGFLPGGTVNDGFAITGGHEVAETITDPAENAWVDIADAVGPNAVSGGEIADKCAWGGVLWNDHDSAGFVTLPTGKFAMQSLWSNVSSPHCVMTGKLLLKVTTPAAQHTLKGHAVSLQIHATISGRTPLRYGSSGLPAGLVLSKTSGKITGKPTVKGTFHVKVTVSYYDGSATVRFTWTVS